MPEQTLFKLNLRIGEPTLKVICVELGMDIGLQSSDTILETQSCTMCLDSRGSTDGGYIVRCVGPTV